MLVEVTSFDASMPTGTVANTVRHPSGSPTDSDIIRMAPSDLGSKQQVMLLGAIIYT